MKYWIRYLKEKRGVILLYLVTALLFIIIGSLYHIENLEKLFYAAMLSAALWGIAGAVQGTKQIKKCIRLEEAVGQIRQSEELLPEEILDCEELTQEKRETAGALEEQLEELLLDICGRWQRERNAWESREADRCDYHLMWAHQIKTPISAMKLLIEGDGGCRENFRMQAELFKIEQYIEMVLTFQRLDSMASDMLLREYALEPLLRQAVRKYSVLFINKGLRVELPDTDCRILTDEKWFSFCLEQLLSNSIKYTEEGKISFWAEEDGDRVLLTIADTGIGISPEDLPRIFERGFTGYNGRLDKKSTGIGLYLCRRIFDRLGIDVRVESEMGKGTRVMLSVVKRKK